MDRREFIKIAGVSAAAAILPDAINADLISKRPNIFLILSDDATIWDFGCYGNKTVKTPNIDKLASEGMRFKNMFTPSPMCAPARAALYTGLYPIRNGCHPNHGEVKPEIKTIAHYMQSLGYRTVLLGKKHARPEANFPFEYYTDDFLTNNRSAGSDAKRILADPGDKPFCIIMCKFDGHYNWPQNNHNYDPAKIDLPPYLVDTPMTRQLRANYYSKITDLDLGVGSVMNLLKETGHDNDTVFIWTADQGTYWPHERQNVYDAALNTPFIVRWPDKIKPGSVSDSLASYVDIVPTFIELAGGDVNEVVSKCGGQSLDGKSLVPVLFGDKQEHHKEVFGCTTFEVLEVYPMRSVRTKQYKYIWNIDYYFQYPSAWTFTDLPYSKEMNAVWKTWEEKAKTDASAAERIRAEKYRPKEELYDIQKDPYELKNLADAPEYKNILDEMRDKCKGWMKQQGDDGSGTYHADTDPEHPFPEAVFCRQKIVNIKMNWLGAAGGLNEQVRVELTSPVWIADIHYTLDGSEPTKNSKLYKEPFVIVPRVTIKARGFWDGGPTPVKELKYWGPDAKFLYEQMHLKPIAWP